MYTSLVRPLLEKLDHENTKNKTINLIHLLESNPLGLKIIEQCAYKQKRFTDTRLRTTVAGITFGTHTEGVDEGERRSIHDDGVVRRGVGVADLHRVGGIGSTTREGKGNSTIGITHDEAAIGSSVDRA